ncbi:MAG: acyl-ACP--UDP-N-acetylglucosamine O-acyltransferase [Granulosicoccaceae bacterium]
MIHPSAVIADGAVLADDVEVGPFSFIDESVEIGEGTVVGPHVVIKGPSKIGKYNKIHQFAAIGDDPQDLKFQGEETWLVMGDHNTIREYATINRGTADGGGYTRIGNHNLLMAYTHVAHDCQLGDRIVFSNGASLAGHVEVGDNVILSGFSLVHQFCKIGAHAFAGMGSSINKDVTPYTLVSGNYATARSINKEGLRRRGFSDEAIKALHIAYKTLLRGSKTDLDDPRVADLAEAHQEVANFVAFIKRSSRGVVRSA